MKICPCVYFHHQVTRVSLAFRACLCAKNEAPERGRSGNMKSKRATVGPIIYHVKIWFTNKESIHGTFTYYMYSILRQTVTHWDSQWHSQGWHLAWLFRRLKTVWLTPVVASHSAWYWQTYQASVPCWWTISSCGMFLAAAVRLPNREDPRNKFDMGAPNWHLKHAETVLWKQAWAVLIQER